MSRRLNASLYSKECPSTFSTSLSLKCSRVSSGVHILKPMLLFASTNSP